jgi:hypothetical protein
MAGERHWRGIGTAWYVWISLCTPTVSVLHSWITQHIRWHFYRIWRWIKRVAKMSSINNLTNIIIFCQCHHMSLMDFVVSPPGCGRSVTDFWGWDARKTQLRCPDEVDGDIWIWSTRRGLKPKFYWTTQTMVTIGIFPFKEKSPW